MSVSPSPGVASRVIISGYFGAGNYGDDLLLRSVLGTLSQHPAIQPVVAAHDASEVERVFGVPAFSRRDPASRDRELRRASGVILGPGGLWNDYGLAEAGGLRGLTSDAKRSLGHAMQLPVEASARGIPVIGFGLGVGPLRTRDAWALMRLASHVVDSVHVRDPHSVELLRQAGFREEQLHAGVDATFALELPTPLRREPVLAVNLREWPSGHANDQLAEFLVQFAKGAGLRVVGVPAQESDGEVLDDLRRSLSDKVDFSLSGSHPDSVTQALGSAQMVVSMRLHPALIAHRLGVPVVGLAYDPKVSSHFAMMGVSHLALPLDSGVADLAEAARVAAQGQTLDCVRESVARARSLAAQDTLQLREWLATLPPGEGESREESTSPISHLVSDVLSTLVPGSASSSKTSPAFHTACDQADGARSIYLESSAPSGGDEAYFRLAVPSSDSGWRVGISTTAHYSEDPALAGRMAHFIRVDGVDLAAVDVAEWSRDVHTWLLLPPSEDERALDIGTRALKDCEAWRWGWAGRITVRALSLESYRVEQPSHGLSVPPSKLRDGRPPQGSQASRLSRILRKLQQTTQLKTIFSERQK